MGKTVAQFQMEIARLEAIHGPMLGATPDPKTTQVTTDYRGEKTTDPNKTPVYVYTFRDGTELRAIGSGGDPGSSVADSYDVVSIDEKKVEAAGGALHYGTDPATGAATVYDPATGQTKPISAGKPVVPAAPDIQIINGNAYKVEPNGNMTLVQDKTLTPGYQPPAAPQGPAYSGTEQGIRLASDLAIARDTIGSDQDLSRSLLVQGQAADLQMIRDKAQADQRTADALAQSEQAMAAKVAERDALRADLIWKLQNGVIVTPEADAALKQWDAMNTADYQSHAKRVLDIEDYNRNLPQLQAQEDRAARTEQRAGQQDKVSALKGQADAGMSAADRMVKLGVSPSDASLRMAYDPYPRMWAILNEKPAAGPQLQTQVAPAAPTPRPMPNIVPPFLQVAPAAPGAAITAPPAPYGGDANAQAAFEGQYPGQDAEEIWRQQRAANGGR